MNLLLLRGQVPQDRDKSEIKYGSLDECDDIYTLMASRIGDVTEVWYWGGERTANYPNLTERWIPDFRHYDSGFKPDVIWARGGFKEYLPVLKRYDHAFKIYYGAGARFIPDKEIHYDLVLTDSIHQKHAIERAIPGVRCELWIKPAPDNLIYPTGCPKIYDVCYMANGTQDKIKRIEWVYETAPKDLKILHLGLKSKHKIPECVYRRRTLRRNVGAEISKCKVGIVPYKEIDSCPRSLVEMMACGLPVVVTDDLRFWEQRYTVHSISSKAAFWDRVRFFLQPGNYERFAADTLANYQNNCSLIKASQYLKGLINECRVGN